MVQGGFPVAFAESFLTVQAEAAGQPAFISGEVKEILGRPRAPSPNALLGKEVLYF
jgi:hypothetical protein